MFQAEPRQHSRRLKQFGVRGHQSAIRAIVKMQVVEVAVLEEAITDQRRGMTRKLAGFIKQKKLEARANNSDVIGIKLKQAALDVTGAIRWKRTERPCTQEAMQTLQHGEGNGAGGSENIARYGPRVLTCPLQAWQGNG